MAYLGYEVLGITAHGDGVISFENEYERRGEPFQSWTKKASERTRTPLEFLIYQAGPAQRKTIRDFYNARKGATTPFWIQSHKNDLELALEGAASSDTITVKPCGLLIGLSNISRHATIPASGQNLKIQNPVEADEGTELGVSPVLSQTLPPGTFLRMLYLVRFPDVLQFTWTGRFRRDGAGVKHRETSAVLSLAELQRETP